jgi:lipoprotein-anchoring transpeptidase ErfK/SrfK
MRRLAGIPIRSAVAVALPLVGAIYLAAEARQAVIRHYSIEAVNLQRLAASQTPIQWSRGDAESNLVSRSGDRLTGPLDDRSAEATHPSHSQTSPAGENYTPASPSDERLAEQQAAQISAQKPPKKTAKDAHTRRIIVSIPDRRLALLEDGQLLKVYPVAVGASETPSPDGEFTIINHAVDPTYRHADKEIGPGKDNPLGTRWMGLSLKGYGIHGTNVQSSVGKAASHGCFRMKKKDVEELYSRVQVGDAVSIRGDRDELTASLFPTTTNASPAAAASMAETQIASVATPSAKADGEQ